MITTKDIGLIVHIGYPISGKLYGVLKAIYSHPIKNVPVCEIKLFPKSGGDPKELIRLVDCINDIRLVTKDDNMKAPVATRNTKPQSKFNPDDIYSKHKECACGCGRKTAGGNFMPGHDMKARSFLNKIDKGQLLSKIPSILIHFIQMNKKLKDRYKHLIVDEELSC